MMGRQYSAVELLRLRESPLVCKPPGLPPPEEWMGAPPDPQPQREQNQRTKRITNKIDESPFATESSGRRPSLFDGIRLPSRTSIPDDIVLGPPKTSFASATAVRNFNKPSDSTDKPSTSTFGDDSSKPDTYSVREKFFKERERSDRDQVGEKTRDFRSGNPSTRRGAREDSDEWTSVKPRRSFGQEDGERFVRRNGDRDNGKENVKDRPSRPFDSYTRDKDRDREKDDPPRRNIPGRGRNEPSWLNNNENTNSTREMDGNKDSIRDRGWRDKNRGGDGRGDTGGDTREWTRDIKRESRPEWMDSTIVDDSKAHEKKPSHTMEEFQRWKERMKASNVSTPTEEKKRSPVEERAVPDQPLLAMPQKIEPMAQKYDSPLILETQEDKFFGLWNEPKRPSDESNSETNHQIPPKRESTRPTVGKSRFQSFFSPQEELQGRGSKTETTTQHNSPPLPMVKDTSNEDKEGFQRILQMLGGTSLDPASSGQQQYTVMPPSRPPTHDRSQSSTNVSSPIQATPPSQALAYNAMGPDQSFPPRSRNATGPSGLQNILGPQMSQSGPQGTQPQNQPQNQPPNSDSEFLFRLMQQSRSQSHLPPLPGQPLLGNSRGMPPLPQISGGPLDRGKLHQGMPQLGIFDDPSVTGYQRPPLQHHNQGPPRDLSGVSSRAQAPPGPPGLGQVPMDWPGNPLGAPQSHQRQIAPPPGLPPQRPQFAPFLPHPPGLPFQMSGMAPPNLPPPPGFFGLNGINGPPGGFPHMPFQPDGFMGMPGPGGHVGGGGAPGGPQVPYPPYAEGINGANGRGAPPGQYHKETRRNRSRFI